MTGIDDDMPVLSRSASSQNLQEPPSTSTNGRLKRKDKGKGREIETSAVRIKEEAPMVSLLSPEPGHLVSTSYSSFLATLMLYGAPDDQPRPLLCLSPAGQTRVLRRLSQGLSSLVSRSADGKRR